MRILLYTDPHFCQYSSIVRKRGNKYSARLENLVESINWVENLVAEKFCQAVFCLGDFFDKPELNAEEITALKEIQWDQEAYHYFLVGNHESNRNNLVYSSTNCLKNIPNCSIIDTPTLEQWNTSHSFLFLPYILEEDRKPLIEYLKESKKPAIIFSHNDIKGIQYGKFESVEGFDLTEIEQNCDMFINGHLHNGLFLNEVETILNLGNLTGQNFSENAFEYKHFACILDTDTLRLEFYENPYAFNFYKVDIKTKNDFNTLNNLVNAVLTIRCSHDLVPELKTYIDNLSNIKEYRIISVKEELSSEAVKEELKLNSIDHLQQFNDFVIEKLGTAKEIIEELNYITGGM